MDEWELYDRKKDPLELNNVFNDPDYAEIFKKLQADLINIRKKYKDSDELDRKFIDLYKENGIIK